MQAARDLFREADRRERVIRLDAIAASRSGGDTTTQDALTETIVDVETEIVSGPAAGLVTSAAVTVTASPPPIE